MTTITFDTLKYAKTLESAGITPVQAEAFVTAQKAILAEALDTTLVTRDDLGRAEVAVKADLTKLDKEMAAMRTDIAVLKWMVGLVIAGVAAQLLKGFFS